MKTVFSHALKSKDRLNLDLPEVSYFNKKKQIIHLKIAGLLIKSV